MKIMQAINESMLHICDVMGAELKESNEQIEGKIYGSSIPVYKNNKEAKKEEIQFFLYFKKEVLKDAADTLLQSNYTEDDLDDLSRELANQIVGYAKNVLNDSGIGQYTLGTPEFLGVVEHFHIKFEEFKIYYINNNILKIGYKQI